MTTPTTSASSMPAYSVHAKEPEHMSPVQRSENLQKETQMLRDNPSPEGLLQFLKNTKPEVMLGGNINRQQLRDQYQAANQALAGSGHKSPLWSDYSRTVFSAVATSGQSNEHRVSSEAYDQVLGMGSQQEASPKLPKPVPANPNHPMGQELPSRSLSSDIRGNQFLRSAGESQSNPTPAEEQYLRPASEASTAEGQGKLLVDKEMEGAVETGKPSEKEKSAEVKKTTEAGEITETEETSEAEETAETTETEETTETGETTKKPEGVTAERIPTIPLNLEGFDENQKRLPIIGLIETANEDIEGINASIDAGGNAAQANGLLALAPKVEQPEGEPPTVERYEYAGGTALLVGVKDPEAVKAQLDKFGEQILAPLSAAEKPEHMTQEEFENAQKTAQTIKQAGEIGATTVIYGSDAGAWSRWQQTNGENAPAYQAALESWNKEREQALQEGVPEEGFEAANPRPKPQTIDDAFTTNRRTVEIGEKSFLNPPPVFGGPDPSVEEPAFRLESNYRLGHELLHVADNMDRVANEEPLPEDEREKAIHDQVEEESRVQRIDYIRSFNNVEKRNFYYPTVDSVIPQSQRDLVQQHTALSQERIDQRQQQIDGGNAEAAVS